MSTGCYKIDTLRQKYTEYILIIIQNQIIKYEWMSYKKDKTGFKIYLRL